MSMGHTEPKSMAGLRNASPKSNKKIPNPSAHSQMDWSCRLSMAHDRRKENAEKRKYFPFPNPGSSWLSESFEFP